MQFGKISTHCHIEALGCVKIGAVKVTRYLRASVKLCLYFLHIISSWIAVITGDAHRTRFHENQLAEAHIVLRGINEFISLYLYSPHTMAVGGRYRHTLLLRICFS